MNFGACSHVPKFYLKRRAVESNPVLAFLLFGTRTFTWQVFSCCCGLWCRGLGVLLVPWGCKSCYCLLSVLKKCPGCHQLYLLWTGWSSELCRRWRGEMPRWWVRQILSRSVPSRKWLRHWKWCSRCFLPVWQPRCAATFQVISCCLAIINGPKSRIL